MKMNKDQFFSALAAGKVKNFKINGVKYYAEGNYTPQDPETIKERLLEFHSEFIKLNVKLDNSFIKEIYNIIHSILVYKFLLKDVEISFDGVRYLAMETEHKKGGYDSALKWLKSAKWSDFKVELRSKSKNAETFYLCLIDKRKKWEGSFISIKRDGKFKRYEDGISTVGKTSIEGIITQNSDDFMPLKFEYDYFISKVLKKDIEKLTDKLVQEWNKYKYSY